MCSATCGDSFKTRTFYIDTNSSWGGDYCNETHKYVETATCEVEACSPKCVGSWSGYSDCSVTCGTGMIFILNSNFLPKLKIKCVSKVRNYFSFYHIAFAKYSMLCNLS